MRYFILLAMLLGCAACADEVPASSPLPTSGSAVPPAQWIEFCQRHPEYQPCSMTNP